MSIITLYWEKVKYLIKSLGKRLTRNDPHATLSISILQGVTMGFNLDNYETVKDRITRFYADHQNGRILTELVNNTDTLSEYAAFKAYIYLDDVLKSTGYAMEQKGQGVNRDAWVENAETSAIGRALANMDYCGTMRPSREEMSKVGNDKQVNDAAAQWVAAIETADTIDNLQKVFADAWRACTDSQSRKELTSAKDIRKIALSEQDYSNQSKGA